MGHPQLFLPPSLSDVLPIPILHPPFPILITTPRCRTTHTCAACAEKIKGQVMTAIGKKWHPTCFKCGNCGLKLTGSFFHKEGVPYCGQECFPK